MSKLYHDSDRLSMELIKKFREGTLSAEEEARLNTLQARDPFLADALEGMALVSNGDFARDVDELRGRIQQRTQTKKSLRLYWLPIAASLAILIGVFYAVYTVLLPSDSSNLSRQEAVPSANAPEQSPMVQSELSPVSQLPPEGLADSQLIKEQMPQTLALVEPSEALAYSGGSSVEDSFYASSVQQAKSDEELQTLTEVESEAFDENFTLSKREKNNQMERKTEASSNDISRVKKLSFAAPQAIQEGWKTISGKVIDQESEDPIPGANILVKETTIGSITDVDGRFVIDLPEDNKKLVISSIGYQTTEVNVNTQDTAMIALEQDIQSLSEVVVIGYGSEGNEGEVSITAAKPLGGMRAYRKYLSDNQKYPADWKEDDKAVVKLSFTVFPNGKLSNITIEKSANEWLDQEAIRLVEDGPAWEPAIRNGDAIGQEVKLRIRFKK